MAGKRRQRDVAFEELEKECEDWDQIEEFKCPITLLIMVDPVSLVHSGHSFERAAIEEWYARRNNYGSCPCSNLKVDNPVLMPNITLRKSIEEYQKKLKEKVEARRRDAAEEEAEPKTKVAKLAHEAFPSKGRGRPQKIFDEASTVSSSTGPAQQPDIEAVADLEKMIEARSKDVAAFLRKMKNPLFKNSNTVQQKGIEGLLLVVEEDKVRERFSQMNGLKVLQDAMVRFKSITELNRLALKFLAALYKDSQGKLPPSTGIIKEVCKVMEFLQGDLYIQDLGCLVLHRLTKFSTINKLHVTKALKNITKALETHGAAHLLHPEDEETNLLRHAFQAISSLSYKHPENQEELVNLKAIQRIKDGIQHNEQDQAIVRAAIKALCCLCLNRKEHKELILKQDLIKIVVDSMVKHQKNAQVQEAGCFFMARMAQNHPESKVKIVAAGGTDQVLRAMSEHQEVRSVQEAGILYFAMACIQHPATRKKAAGLKVVIKAMQTFKAKERDRIYDAGCMAISNFALYCTPPERKALAHDAIPIVSIVIRSDTARLQAVGMLALRHLMHDNQEAVEDLQAVKADVTKNVNIALKDFRHDPEVQRQGKAVLKLFG